MDGWRIARWIVGIALLVWFIHNPAQAGNIVQQGITAVSTFVGSFGG